MEPKLALNYSSQARNGGLGMGWSLSGLSAITRCPQTVAQDGARWGVNHDADDRFCLDGQRLVVLNGGTYGGSNTEYRTERDSFARITAASVTVGYDRCPSRSNPSCGTNYGVMPQSLTVKTKAGLTMEYGVTADSRIEAQGTATVRLWALNKVSDTKGNYLTVTYNEDNVNGDYYPTKIEYTGNGAQQPTNSVQFSYQSRTDITPLYVGGSVIKIQNRLTDVKTYVGATAVKQYTLTYDYGAATNRSRVVDIAECDGSSNCLPSTNLVWQTGGSGFNAQTKDSQLDPYLGWNWVGDFNGDGKSDIAAWIEGSGGLSIRMHLSNGSGFDTQVWPSQMYSLSNPGRDWNWVGDFNGDGKADMASWVPGSNGNSIMMQLSTGTGFVIQQWPAQLDPYAGWNWVGDFNGDGKADIASWIEGSGGSSIRIHLSNGSGFDIQPPWSGQFYSLGVGYNWVGDFNGDGRSDIASWINGSDGLSIHIHLSNGAGFDVKTWSSRLYSLGSHGSDWNWLGDFNGDGLTDIASWVNGSGGSSVRIHFSTGTGFNIRAWTSQLNSAVGWNWVGDFDGDGKSDIAAWIDGSGGASIRLHLSRADEFNIQSWNSQLYSQGTRADDWNWLGDFDGDGKLDFAAWVAGSNGYSISLNFNNQPFPDIATSITSGLGATTSIVYEPLTDSTVYTKDNNATYPTMDLQVPLYVVSSATSSNGIGGTVSTSYTYGGAKLDWSGRGLLGFRWTEAVDGPSGLKLRTEFNQGWPYVGLPTLVKKTTAGGATLSQVTNTYACRDFDADPANCTVTAGKRYFAYVSQSVLTQNDLNGAALPTITTGNSGVDDYGNIGLITVSTSDGYITETNNTWGNDSNNWILGRLTKSTVTNTTP